MVAKTKAVPQHKRMAEGDKISGQKLAAGGKVKEKHSDIKEDKKLIREMVKPEDLKKKRGGEVKKPVKKCAGGRIRD